jgi:hypothetical protein
LMIAPDHIFFPSGFFKVKIPRHHFSYIAILVI